MVDDYANEPWLIQWTSVSWLSPDCWARYFTQVQEILGARITHLDDDDPIRRRFDKHSLDENAEFVVRFGEKEESRMLFGQMASIDVRFSIDLHRKNQIWPNVIHWHAPPMMFDDPALVERICRLFECGNTSLDVFYGYVDTCERQKLKKKEDGGIDFQKELIGVFWLTYFNNRYVEFFGREKFAALQNVAVKFNGGATLRLGETPASVPDGLREEVENKLGPKSFVRYRDFTVKRPGQYALTFEQLRS